MKTRGLIFLLLTLWKIGFSQETNSLRDTIFFSQNDKLEDAKFAHSLKRISEQIKSSKEYFFTIETNNDNINAEFSCYSIYEYLILICGIEQHRLRIFSYDNCPKNAIVIRISTEKENEGTNCGVPLRPKLRK